MEVYHHFVSTTTKHTIDIQIFCIRDVLALFKKMRNTLSLSPLLC
jgi:hypothetical protein